MITRADQDPNRAIKALLWVYFWMLLWEGALRKWVFPGLSDLLFIIRDPIVIIIYVQALRTRVFPWGPAVASVVFMAALSLLFSVADDVRFMTVLFGVRTDFLHLPLIFVMARVLDRSDVIRYGKWFLICSIPILAIMIKQFNEPVDSSWNVAVGGAVGGQLRGSMGRIRPPGPFSFISGPVDYFSVVAAFVYYGWLQPRTYGRLFLVIATAVTITAVPVSISRSLLLAVLIVAAFGLAVTLKDPRRIPNFLGPLIATAGFMVFMTDSIYVQAFDTRWDETEMNSEAGFYDNGVLRSLGVFAEPFDLAADTPALGYGIGLGTVGGAHLDTGKYGFLLAESEMARCVLELGPVLGFMFIGWRVWLCVYMIYKSWRYFIGSGDPLAWLIAGSTFLGVLIGQWGPTTNLGFSVFGAGLTLAAMNEPVSAKEEVGEGLAQEESKEEVTAEA